MWPAVLLANCLLIEDWIVFMRIVYFSEAAIPSRSANSVHIMKMCSALAKQGNEVFLLAPGYKKIEKYVGNLYEFYGVDKNFEVVKFNVPFRRGKGLFYIWQAGKYAKKLNPDLVMGRFFKGCFFCSLLGLKTVYEFHGPVDKKSDEHIFRGLAAVNRIDKMVVLSQRLQEHFIEKYNISASKIIVAYNAADALSRNEDYPVLKGEPGAFKVGFTGHLYSGKGMEIIEQLSRRMEGIEFHVIGGLPQDIEIWQQKLAECNNVFFYGYIPPSRVPYYRDLFDVLLLPVQEKVNVYGGNTFEQPYSPPLKLFEYMESGRAIVASNYLDEVLINGETALLCNPAEITEWEEAINYLYFNPQYKKKLGANARKEFFNYYTWAARAEKIINNW